MQAFVDVHFPPTMRGSGGKVGAGHDQKKLGLNVDVGETAPGSFQKTKENFQRSPFKG